MIDPEDPAALAAEALFAMIDSLQNDYGLSKNDILAGVHGELMRQMIEHVGCSESVRLVRKAADTITEFSKRQTPAQALATMGVLGRA